VYEIGKNGSEIKAMLRAKVPGTAIPVICGSRTNKIPGPKEKANPANIRREELRSATGIDRIKERKISMAILTIMAKPRTGLEVATGTIVCDSSSVAKPMAIIRKTGRSRCFLSLIIGLGTNRCKYNTMGINIQDK
jgi:hypothetical protein